MTAGRLQDRTVIITGASAGMGEAMMRLFVAEGANVVAVSRTEERLAHSIAGVGCDERIAAVAVDVASPAAADIIVTRALERFGGIHVVVNNAGVGDGFQLAGEIEDDVWQRTIDVNLTGPMRLCRRALAIFCEQNDGVFVATSSVAGLRGGRSGASYTVAKHGLIGLMRSIAATYSDRGIRANAIAAGWTATSMDAGAELSRNGWRQFRTVAELNPRIAEATEIAQLALFLASDAASALNGAVVAADSGWSVR